MSLLTGVARHLPGFVRSALRGARDRSTGYVDRALDKRPGLKAALLRRLRPGDAVILRSLCGGSPWCLDSVTVSEGRLVVRGWALDLAGGGEPNLRVGGIEFESQTWALRRRDIEDLFWFVPGAGSSGFISSIPVADLPAPPWEVSRAASGGGPASDPDRSYHWDPDAGAGLPLPPAELRARVHGSPDADSFLLEGFTTHVKLQRAIERECGRRPDEFRSILDWGCGCGRTTRFLAGSGAAITGVDIDEVNIAWSRDNLPFARFQTIPTAPPTDLPAEGYDLLVGISVFSHLDEAAQEVWLAELRRLAAPNAVLAMSVHGSQSLARSGIKHRALRDWLKNGFFDLGANPDQGATAGREGEYRDVGQSSRHIRANWSRHFEIITIVEGCIGNHQDLVLMKPRPRAPGA